MPRGFGTMPDYGARIADRAFSQSARKIREVYRQAAVELQDKFADFLEKHRKKGAEMLEKLTKGEITQAEYHSWMRGQVFIGKQWKHKIDSSVKMLGTANRQCEEIIRNGRVHVFAENYNYTAYQMEKRLGGAVSFNLYSEQSVAVLLKKKPKMLPEWKINERKDYAWNRQKVENAVTQGIIHGEGIDQITNRLVDSLCTQNENRMRLFARTSMTGAQNAGRMEMLHDAEDDGIKVKKKWLATLDSRTRDTHQDLDGQVVDVDEPFVVDGMEIMFPGDPSCAHPELVYNCRCTLEYVVEGFENHGQRRDQENDTLIDSSITYRQWKEGKR